MAASDLRPEVEQAVPRVDLPATEGEVVGQAVVDARLAGDGDPLAGLGRESLLSLTEEP